MQYDIRPHQHEVSSSLGTAATTTTKPYPTKWGQLHSSNDISVLS